MSGPLQNAVESCVSCGALQKLMFSYKGHQYYRCTQCKVVSTYPLPTDDAIHAHYARKFQSGNYQLLRDYAEEYKRQVYTLFVEILEAGLATRHESLSGRNVLDVGCFTGEFLELLHEKNVDVYGLELQSDAVKIASQKFPGHIYQADVHGNDYPQMEFDIVTLLGVVEHVVDPVQLLERSAELLKSGGVILIQTPNSASLWALLMRSLWPPYAPVEHIHLFSRQGLVSLLGRLKFTEITVKPHWKRLSVNYVYEMMQNYGSEFRKIIRPFYVLLPDAIKRLSLPFYIGEMIIIARKN